MDEAGSHAGHGNLPSLNLNEPQPDNVANIIHELEGYLHNSYDPRATPQQREEAFHRLENFKVNPEAAWYGHALAADPQRQDTVRYYGLQVLEFSLRFNWARYGAGQVEQLIAWTRGLAAGLRARDSAFVQNKVAQLWAVAAERAWAAEWVDMDNGLRELWSRDPVESEGPVPKLFVLSVLEALSEDVMVGENVANEGYRTELLSASLNEIVVPEAVYRTHALERGKRQEVRFGDEGWLFRVCDFFRMCVKHATINQNNDREMIERCALKSLVTLRSLLTWISFKAAEEVNVVRHLFLAFSLPNVGVQLAAVEALYTLLSRGRDVAFQDVRAGLLREAIHPDRILLLRHAFEATYDGLGSGDDDAIDDEKYTLHRKLSELLSVLAEGIAQHPELAEDPVDLPSILDLLLIVLRSESLTVSIPVLHSWTKLIISHDLRIVDLVLTVLGTLLQTCSERLVRYEAFPEDSNNKVVALLRDDFDTVPERHAFLGNYRRYCITIIQQIARSRPSEALMYALEQMRNHLQSGPYTFAQGFDSATYSKSAPSVLTFEAQCQLVTSTLKGYAAWTEDIATVPHEDPVYARGQRDLQTLSSELEQWCQNMFSVHVDDPDVADLIMQILGQILRILPSPSSAFVLKMVHHFLTMSLSNNPAHTTYSDTIQIFENQRVVELQKLAIAYPNDLMGIYPDLEASITALMQKHREEPRLVWGYQAFLFMIAHRAQGIEHEMRLAKLRDMLNPLFTAWSDPTTDTAASSFEGFCEALGLGGIAEFYKAHGFDRCQDWSAQELDAAGREKQSEIKRRCEAIPLRMTRVMLTATTEKLRSGTEEYEIACELWSGLIPIILPKLLQMVGFAQAYHNMENWSQLPGELQQVVKRTMQDRFWQSGISNESKEEFYARISGSKTSYEGFASSVRAALRNNREMGLHILYSLAKFDEQFYGLTDLAQPLANVLFSDAGSLSANHLHPIINLTTGLVQRCPPQRWAQFLPLVLNKLFSSMDVKISNEWETLDRVAVQLRQENDELSDEMRTESVLRQLTYSMVAFVPFLLELDRPIGNATNGNQDQQSSPPTLADLVLSDLTVLEPMMLFCTHALRMRDQRCCQLICRVFRAIIPRFARSSTTTPSSPSAPSNDLNPVASSIREFICTEVLKACITSLHEPYFVDMQRDLAALIALILLSYVQATPTPREVLLSLPDMSERRVDHALERIFSSGLDRTRRTAVLELLSGVRGKSIQEEGRIDRSHASGAKRPRKAAVQQQYMEVEPKGLPADGEELEGVADLFG